MYLHTILSGRLHTRTLGNHLILQAALRRDHALFRLVLSQEFLALLFRFSGLTSLSLYEIGLQILLRLLRRHLHSGRITLDSLDETSDQIVHIGLATRQGLQVLFVASTGADTNRITGAIHSAL